MKGVLGWDFFEEENIKISGYKFPMTVKICVRFWDGLALCQSHSIRWTMCWLHEPFFILCCHNLYMSVLSQAE